MDADQAVELWRATQTEAEQSISAFHGHMTALVERLDELAENSSIGEGHYVELVGKLKKASLISASVLGEEPMPGRVEVDKTHNLHTFLAAAVVALGDDLDVSAPGGSWRLTVRPSDECGAELKFAKKKEDGTWCEMWRVAGYLGHNNNPTAFVRCEDGAKRESHYDDEVFYYAGEAGEERIVRKEDLFLDNWRVNAESFYRGPKGSEALYMVKDIQTGDVDCYEGAAGCEAKRRTEWYNGDVTYLCGEKGKELIFKEVTSNGQTTFYDVSSGKSVPLRQECVDGHPERTAFYDATGTNIVRTNTGCVSFHFKLLSGDRRLWMINVNEQCAFQIGTSDENLDIVLNCITEDGVCMPVYGRINRRSVNWQDKEAVKKLMVPPSRSSRKRPNAESSV